MPDPEVEMNMIYERLQPHMRDAFTRVLQWHVDSQAQVDKQAWDELWEYLKEELVKLQLEALEYKTLYESAAENIEKLSLEVYKLNQELWRLKPEVSETPNGGNN
jgi:hypothetical protein